MCVPPVNFARLSEDTLPRKGSPDDLRARAVIVSLIGEAWTKLIRSHDSIMRIDLDETNGPTETAPRLEDGGDVLDLFLSVNLPPLEDCLDDDEVSQRNRDHVRSVLFHEVSHVADRLDRAFELPLHGRYGGAEQNRDFVNAVWDVYIEWRKFQVHAIRPFACFLDKYDTFGPKEAVLANLCDVVRNLGGRIEDVDAVFGEVWGNGESMTFSRLAELATRLSPLNPR